MLMCVQLICATWIFHLIVESFLYHQGVSFQVEELLRVHRHPQRHVVTRVNLHQLDVGCVVLQDRHGPRWDGADWDRERGDSDLQTGRQADRQTNR